MIFIDSERCQLNVGGKTVPIGGQSKKIMDCLIAKDGQIARREELKSLLWPGASRVDTDLRLNTAVKALRNLLSDAEICCIEIETVRGEGYRLLEPRSNRLSRFCRARLRNVRFTHKHRFLAQFSLALIFGVFVWIGHDHLSGLQTSAESAEPANPDDRPALYNEGKLPEAITEEWRMNPTPATLEAALAEAESLRRQMPDDSDVYVTLGELALFGKWNWAESEQLLLTAIDLNSENFEARRLLAWNYLLADRRSDLWRQVAYLLSEQNPPSDRKADLGWILLRMEEHDLAHSHCQERLGKDSPSINLLSCQHTALARLGRLQDARRVAVKIMRILEASSSAVLLAESGDAQTGYEYFLQWRVEAFPDVGESRFRRAQLLADAGRLDKAEYELIQAYRRQDPLLVKLGKTPELAPLMERKAIATIWQSIRGG